MDEEKQVWWWLVGDGDKGHEGLGCVCNGPASHQVWAALEGPSCLVGPLSAAGADAEEADS